MTSVASGYSTKSSTSIKSIFTNPGRRKSSSRNSSVDHEDIANEAYSQNTKQKRKKSKKNVKKKRVKSYDNGVDEKDEEEINITISAKTKTKKKKDSKWRAQSMSTSPNPPSSSLSSLSKTAAIKERKKREKKRTLKKQKIDEDKDYLDMDLEEMVSSSSSSSDIENDDFLLLSDENADYDATTAEYALDHNGQFVEHNVGTNNLRDYVELKLVKYPGTGELYLIVTKFDEKTEAMEVFRCDFAKCTNIEKNEIEEDFSIFFENITLAFRADNYEKANQSLITLRQFFDQHSTNLQPELPPPPDTFVTDQMNLFFGGF